MSKQNKVTGTLSIKQETGTPEPIKYSNNNNIEKDALEIGQLLTAVITSDDTKKLEQLKEYLTWTILGLKEPVPMDYDPDLKKLKNILKIWLLIIILI